MGKLAKPRMAAMLVVYGNTVRVQTANETLRLDCIVEYADKWYFSGPRGGHWLHCDECDAWDQK